MKRGFWLPAVGAIFVVSCTSGPTTPDGAVLFDEEISLVRGSHVDSAQREIKVERGSVIVALVDEQLPDVKVSLEVIDSGAKTPAPIEVENNLRGAGIEVASLAASRDSRIRVTLTGAQDAKTPGHVRLRLRRFDAETNNFAPSLAAFKSWSAATNSSYRVDTIETSALADMDRAIAALESAQGDAALAAQARLVKSNMLNYFHLDPRDARAEAQRAAHGFSTLPTPDRLGEARANYQEALALMQISIDRKSVNPTADEAIQLAREALTSLSAASSVFGAVERAGAVGAMGHLDFSTVMLDDAEKRFEEARTIYQDAGYSAGELEMRCNPGHGAHSSAAAGAMRPWCSRRCCRSWIIFRIPSCARRCISARRAVNRSPAALR